MPHIIRHTLTARIRRLPALRDMLDDLTEATGLPVRFWAQSDAPGEDDSPESVPLCAWLKADAAGCRQCLRFRQKLRDEASGGTAAAATCDAGLWEALVPVRIGGQTAGYLLLAGCADEPVTTTNVNRARHLLGRAGVNIAVEEYAMLRGKGPAVPPRRREALMRLMQLSAERIALLLTEHLVTAPSALPPLVAQACTLVHVEFATGLSLAGLARRFEVSEGHFSRMFHHATGLRFVEYLARYRAERAKALLQTSPAPITEIAHACGFRSVSQFNRVFRAVHATTPRALRASFPSPSAPDAFNRP